MRSAVQIFLSLLVLSTISVTGAWVLSYGLTPERRHAQLRRSLLVWSLKGLLVPLAIWTLMNLGLSWNLQPFMPQVQAAQNSGSDWFQEYLRVVAIGLFVISSYWTAVTLGWTLVEASRSAEGETRAQLKALCLTCLIAMVVPALLLVFFGGWSMLGLAGIALFAPMAGYGAAILHAKKMPPMYARAIARMKFGKYPEAEREIIRELEKCEDDFDGWMMLAELYANQFNDLPEAEQSILEICEQPRTRPSQLSIALHKLADWHLQRAGDPAAARRDLQMICTRLPGTHLARMAQLRINQLPASPEELRRQQISTPIPLPALSETIDKAPAHPDSAKQRHEAAEAANACVELLKHDPDNVPARERLARLFAEHLDKPELAIEQVNLLLDMPDQPDGRRAEWLSLTAAWCIRYLHDSDTGRKTLERLIREFPQSVQAFAARRRLQLLDAESKR
jgi:tetratricopeptide (TPR) repeat protein